MSEARRRHRAPRAPSPPISHRAEHDDAKPVGEIKWRTNFHGRQGVLFLAGHLDSGHADRVARFIYIERKPQ